MEDFLRDMCVARLNDLLGETLKTILDLPSVYDELAGGLKGRVADDFAKYGLELVDFLIGGITPPEEVQKMMDERAGMGAIGDMQRYVAFKAARGIEAAASNPGGGAGDAASLGLGAGFGMMLPGMIAGALGNQPRPGGGAPAGGAPGNAPAATVPCPKCQTALPAGAKFCGNCGAAMPAAIDLPEVPGPGAGGIEVLRELRELAGGRGGGAVLEVQHPARARLEVLRELRRAGALS